MIVLNDFESNSIYIVVERNSGVVGGENIVKLTLASLQFEQIFRLLLKISVERGISESTDYFCSVHLPRWTHIRHNEMMKMNDGLMANKLKQSIKPLLARHLPGIRII